MNWSLGKLKEALEHSNRAKVYYYVIDSILRSESGEYIQAGSGPNWQGGVITLCTCKRRMRTALPVENWQKDVWVAGFAGVDAENQRNALVYLFKVERACESYFDLRGCLTEETIQSKSSVLHRLGDLYLPRPDVAGGGCFDPSSYIPPCKDHTHAKEWHKDISYRGYAGRRHALLVGSPEDSFLWDKPVLWYTRQSIGRGFRKDALADFLEYSLQEGGI